MIGAATALTAAAVVMLIRTWPSVRAPLAVLSLVAVSGTGIFVVLMWLLLLLMHGECYTD
jgi:hypothetical protein